MKSTLVKTKSEIFQEIADSETANEGDNISKEKVLILPEGLDKLEEMLKETVYSNSIPHLEEAFARFKKENGL